MDFGLVVGCSCGEKTNAEYLQVESSFALLSLEYDAVVVNFADPPNDE